MQIILAENLTHETASLLWRELDIKFPGNLFFTQLLKDKSWQVIFYQNKITTFVKEVLREIVIKNS